MNCWQIKNKLPSFQEEKLSAPEMVEIEKHLKQCSECNQAKVELNSTWEMLTQVESFESAPFFWTRLLQRKAEREKPVRKTSLNPLQWFSWPAITMAVLIIAFLAGFYFGKTIFYQATTIQETKIEQNVSDNFSVNELDDYATGGISEAYVSLLSENSN